MNPVLKGLFVNAFGGEPLLVEPIKADASDRKIFRMSSADHSAIGIENPVPPENRAFMALSEHFRAAGLNVPKIYAIDQRGEFLLEEDLGSTTLFDLLTLARKKDGREDQSYLPREVEPFYRAALESLVKFQIVAGEGVNYKECYPFQESNRDALLWDMRYFRDNFLRRTGAAWNHHALEVDFERLAEFLLEADSNYFMYRDFQSRNIMVKNSVLYFIDYQHGRRGQLQYDVASLLYQSRAALPAQARTELLDHYLKVAEEAGGVKRERFLKYFHGFVLLRLLQVLGTYGDRGLGEKRDYFLRSIPFAMENLKSLMQSTPLPLRLPTLSAVLESVFFSFESDRLNAATPQALRVSISSFSYRTGVPRDNYDQSGGFVFDCRCLPNPGREIRFRDKTGLDSEVIGYFLKRKEVDEFLNHVFSLVDQAIENYIARGFLTLSVAFGCTGGQHRSVYCSEQLKAHLANRYAIESEVTHIQLEQGLLGVRQ